MMFFNNEYTKYHSDHKSWKNGLFSATVIMVFLLLFQPFGFRDKDFDLKLSLFPGYSLIAFIYTTSTFYIIRKILKSKKVWMLKDEIIYLFISMFPLVLIIHLYTYWIAGDMPFNFIWYFRLTYHISCLMILIAVMEYFYYSNKSADVHIEHLSSQIQYYSQQIAHANTNQLVTITLEKDSFTINLEKIVYIESKSNYLEFYLIEKDGEIKKLVKRGRLHRVETDLANYPEFFRCHRAFIVNLQKAKQIKGNSKNARLIFNEKLEEIPVSRTHFTTLTKKLDIIIAS